MLMASLDCLKLALGAVGKVRRGENASYTDLPTNTDHLNGSALQTHKFHYGKISKGILSYLSLGIVA